MRIRHSKAPLFTGGSATGLSAIDAWHKAAADDGGSQARPPIKALDKSLRSPSKAISRLLNRRRTLSLRIALIASRSRSGCNKHQSINNVD